MLKQFVGKLLTNCLSVFDHFAGMVLKGALSCLRQILATESPLKLMKIVFLFHLKSSFRSPDISFFVLNFRSW